MADGSKIAAPRAKQRTLQLADLSFDDEGQVYDFAGNGTEITRQIGNAVPCRTAQALVRALMEG